MAGEDLEIRLLGPIEVVVEGQSRPLGGPRPAALLALLAMHVGRTVPSERLIEDLWSGEAPEGAATTLKSYVSRLRPVLGTAASILGSREGYALRTDPSAVDVAPFEAEITAARSAAHARRWHSAIGASDAAIARWRGRPFGQWSDLPALLPDAGRLTALYLEAQELRAEAGIAVGRAGELVDDLERLVAEHPYRERLWRLLMLALFHAERQADALAAYHRARSALDEELGIEPGQELRDLETAILRHEVEPIAAQRSPGRALPHDVSSFVGRALELDRLRPLIGGHRLVTLVGPGGVGKTRLAIEALRGTRIGGCDAVAFVDLALVADPAEVAGHVGRSLGVPEVPGRAAVDAILEELEDACILMLLDNCEHVHTAVASLVAGVLGACPEVRIVTTSREVLGVAGEVTYAVGPLGVTIAGRAADGAAPSAGPLPDAVALFIARLQEARPGFVVDPAALEQAERVCRSLDGLPLALELAASRGRVLSLPEISERIADRFRFLVSWRRVSAARHRTLREAMDWSYELLAPDERSFLRRCAVFVGGFTIAAASAVCAGGNEDEALRLVSRLVDASLLAGSEGVPESRYNMLETVRQYAISASDEAERAAAAAAHTAHYLAVAEALHAAIPVRGDAAPLRDLHAEDANLRACLRRIDEAGDVALGLRFAASLWRYWWLNGLLADGREFIERALARRGGPDAARTETLRGASSLALRQGDIDAAVAHSQAAVRLAGSQGEAARSRAEVALANAVGSAGDISQALALYAGAAATFRRLGLSWDLANALLNTADAGFLAGDLELVERAASESLAISRASGDDAGIAVNLGNLAFAALERGASSEAETMFREAYERSTRLEFGEWVAIMVGGLGSVAAARGSDIRAARLLGVAERIREDIGASLDSIERRVHERTVATLRARMGAEAFEAEIAAGRVLTGRDAAAFVLEA